jgi:hypothetical protein
MSVESALEHLRDGTAPSVARAVAELKDAARAGAPEAPRHLATLAAAGVGMPQSWARALSSLFAAALAGSDSARGQLTVLSASPPPGADHDDDPNYWRRLCASVHIEDWLKPCEKRVLNTSPRMVAIEDFLPGRVCAWIIGRANDNQSTAWAFDIVDSDVVMLLTRQRIAATVGVPLTKLETSRLFRYPPDGSKPELHPDQRAAVTFLVYLSDAFKGGEAPFPNADLSHRARPGDAVYFGDPDVAEASDPRAIHEDLARTPGENAEKWVFSQWMHDRACA